LRERSKDLNRSNGSLESIVAGVRSGVVALDRGLHVIAWNYRSEDLWGCAQTTCAARISSISTSAFPPINCARACAPHGRRSLRVHGVILLMEEQSTPARMN
jgi:nitrogen fixation/metabolism regulation signal transduction histidine kinase